VLKGKSYHQRTTLGRIDLKLFEEILVPQAGFYALAKCEFVENQISCTYTSRNFEISRKIEVDYLNPCLEVERYFVIKKPCVDSF